MTEAAAPAPSVADASATDAPSLSDVQSGKVAEGRWTQGPEVVDRGKYTDPDGAEPVETKAAPKAEPQTHEDDEAGGDLIEVKIDGKVEQLTLDQLKAGYQKNAAATRKFQEAKRLFDQAQQERTHVEQKMEGILGRAAEDPSAAFRLLRSLGHDPVQLAEAWLTEALQMKRMPAHERERMEVERDRRRLERERQEWEAQQQTRQLDAETDSARADFERAFTEGLEAKGIPVTRYHMARLANLAQQHLGVEGVTVPDLVELLADELVEERKSSFGSIEDDEQLVQMLGEDVADRIRRYYAGKVKGAAPERPRPQQARPKARDEQGRFERAGSRISRGQRFRDKFGIV